MCAQKNRKVKPARRAKVTVGPASSSGGSVQTWPDDPISGLNVISVTTPNLAKALAFKIKGAVIPAGIYKPGTPEFRYWNAAAALRRGGDFWTPLLNVKQWQPGSVLAVGLDEGQDFNAYYDRSELAFFHDTAGGKVIFSGESPDIVCHEMGHACLDAHRPQLWGAPFIEAGAFHESFGDTSAILSALQLPQVRLAAIDGLAKFKASPLSRLAEQLGWAIRQSQPTDVDSDCLRNAYNRFQYVDPQTLPNYAPADKLCAEVHSFSRVFTGAFYEILGGMLTLRNSKPTDADLTAVAKDYATLLLEATQAAPVVPQYFAQVASHMIDADTTIFGGKYRLPLVNTFVARKILASATVQPLLNYKGPTSAKNFLGIAASMPDLRPKTAIRPVVLEAKQYGLGGGKLQVDAPYEQKQFLMVSAAVLNFRASAEDEVASATRKFVDMLFDHKRVDTTTRKVGLTAAVPRTHEYLRKTHTVVEADGGLKLVRRLFHCGCRF
jgi:hypothetical protein